MDYKLIAVLNTNYSVAFQMNSLAHLALGLAYHDDCPDFKTSRFLDVQNQTVALLSDYPFIILSSEANTELQNFYGALRSKNIACNAFFKDMLSGDVQSQIDEVRQRRIDAFEYVAVVAFGLRKELDKLTKSFKLYR